MATISGTCGRLSRRIFQHLTDCELCCLGTTGNRSRMKVSTCSFAINIRPWHSSLLRSLLRNQSGRFVYSCTSLNSQVKTHQQMTQSPHKYSPDIKPESADGNTNQSSAVQPSLPDLNQRVENAIQSTLDHVTPCPIEAKDGNKGDVEVVSVASSDEWREQRVDMRQLPSLYLQLSKSRLTGLVVISALAGYGMAPGLFEASTCALMALGTFMTSCSANTVNQYFEVPYDSQMARTRNRVLVKGLLSPLHAVMFASVIGTAGIGLLAVTINPLSALIAASTWILYVSVYTPLKRISIVNTWVGALVGALPPAIGWAACTGSLAPGALLMAAFLYTWQFPHFNALSWNLRSDYSRGGFRMMSTTNPALCRRVALRHCLAMIGLCTVSPMLDLTTWTFALDSLPLNLWLTYLGWRFYKHADSKSAKQLFKFTLLHLPVLIMLLLISKKSLYTDSNVVTSVELVS